MNVITGSPILYNKLASFYYLSHPIVNINNEVINGDKYDK